MTTTLLSGMSASIILGDGNLSDAGYNSGSESIIVSRNGKRLVGQTQKFPHTRAQLAAIAREFRQRRPMLTAAKSDSSNASLSPVESIGARDSSGTESDVDGEDNRPWDELRMSSTLVRQVASLLAEENEDELKNLLKTHFEMDDEAVSEFGMSRSRRQKFDTSFFLSFLFLSD